MMVPEKDQPPELVARRMEVVRQVGFVVGLLVALAGSYMAVTAAFGAREYCNQLGCVDTSSPDEVWIGLVLTVAGGFMAYRCYRVAHPQG